jgi:hypothetical protein
MTELTTYRPATAAEISFGPDFGSELITRAVQQMAGAAKLGEALAMTAFVPAAFRGKPDDAAAAIMYGAALGLDPMTSLRAVYVVSGTPGLYARQMVAVVISRGHKVWTVESTDASVTVSGQRRGSDTTETVTWTYDRARKAGYTSNKKYDTDPQAMLWARAAGDVARRIAPDALAGLDYSVEELQVIDHVEDAPRPKRESAAALLGGPKPEPDVVISGPAVPAPVTTTVAPEPDAVPMVTSQQLKKIGATMRDLGITEKAHALGYIEKALGLKIASRSELTRDEAGRLIDALDEDVAKSTEPDDAQYAADVPDGNAES